MRCKMTLENKSEYGSMVGFTQTKLEFRVVTNDTPENKLFFKYTPSGTITLDIVNPEAVKDLKVGAEYYVDFTEAS